MKKHFITIRLKLFAQIVAILLLAILAFLALNYWYLGDIYITNEKKNMTGIADEIDNLDFSSESFANMLRSYESESGIMIDVYDENGEQLYESSIVFMGTSGKLSVLSRDESADGSFFEIQQAEGSGMQYIVYCRSLKSGGELEMFSRKSTIDANTDVALTVMGYTAIAAVLIAAFVIFLYTGKFTKPLIRMSAVTKNMAQLDFSEKIDENTHDEIGLLAGSINELSNSLDTALKDLNEKNERLLDDIEQEKKLDTIRKSFVSNVSHELKTPISIIQGYAEGLKIMLPENENSSAGDYCDIIMNETEKMNSLVLQLLELSSYEAGGNQLKKENFSISALVNEYYNASKMVLDENQIDFSVDIDKSFIGFGDIVKINMVLNNYISNAVSHANGEKKITVSCLDNGEMYRLYVFNTGEHIKNEDIENIWQSFYRADKSRSRKDGRFGLGLSIVSAICNLHETKYGVENVENGVRFFADIEKGE